LYYIYILQIGHGSVAPFGDRDTPLYMNET